MEGVKTVITGENGRAAKTYLSLADVAEIYGYTRKAVQDMARRGVLPGAKKCGSR